MNFEDWLFAFFIDQYPYIGTDLSLGFKPHVPRHVLEAIHSLLDKEFEKRNTKNIVVKKETTNA